MKACAPSPDRAHFRSRRLTFCFTDPRGCSPWGRLAQRNPPSLCDAAAEYVVDQPCLRPAHALAGSARDRRFASEMHEPPACRCRRAARSCRMRNPARPQGTRRGACPGFFWVLPFRFRDCACWRRGRATYWLAGELIGQGLEDLLGLLEPLHSCNATARSKRACGARASGGAAWFDLSLIAAAA